MKKANNNPRGEASSSGTVILEQMTIDPPKSEEISSKNILNNTEISADLRDNFTPDSVDGKSSEKSKTPDPVSEFGTFENDNHIENHTGDEDDNLLFSRLFPGVSREKIENDEKFKLFAKGREKSMPFSAVYSDFLVLIDKISADVIEKRAFLAQAAASSPGSLASSDTADGGFFTKEQVLRMSREQIARNYEKIRKSQEKW